MEKSKIEPVFFQRLSPVDGSVTWAGNWASVAEVDAAANLTAAAFQAWSKSSLEFRCEIAKAYAVFLDDNRAGIARTITLEAGKPLWESDQEIQSAIAKVSNAIEAIQQRRWTTTTEANSHSTAIRYRALGRMVVLGPYNLPLHLPGAHIVPALLAGNTVLLKASEKTPGVGEWIRRAWHSAQLPHGVLECIHGAIDQARYAVSLNDNAGVLFTGSYAAGVQLHRQLAGRPECILALEMGGNNALVIDRVSNRKAAIATIIQSAFVTSGQRCTCARRLIIIDHPQNRDLLEELSESIQRIKTANPLDFDPPFLGTLVSATASQSILGAQENYRSLGAAVINESRALENDAMLTPGMMYADKVAANKIVSLDEEHFGPLLLAYHAKDIGEAVELANQTRFGLAAGLISDDRSVYDYFVKNVRAGIVNWNSPTTGASGRLPFGGIGSSGNHRPSGYFAADYCSYPVASVENSEMTMPAKLPPGLGGI